MGTWAWRCGQQQLRRGNCARVYLMQRQMSLCDALRMRGSGMAHAQRCDFLHSATSAAMIYVQQQPMMVQQQPQVVMVQQQQPVMMMQQQVQQPVMVQMPQYKRWSATRGMAARLRRDRRS